MGFVLYFKYVLLCCYKWSKLLSELKKIWHRYLRYASLFSKILVKQLISFSTKNAFKLFLD